MQSVPFPPLGGKNQPKILKERNQERRKTDRGEWGVQELKRHPWPIYRLEFSLPMVFAVSFLNHVTGILAVCDVCTSSTMRSALVLSVKNMK